MEKRVKTKVVLYGVRREKDGKKSKNKGRFIWSGSVEKV